MAGPPPYGHAFDVGVAQRNALHLEVRRFDPAAGERVRIILPLIAQDGAIVNVPVVDDVGLAGTTGRYEDLHPIRLDARARAALIAFLQIL
jgi:hypothetical protein